MSIWIQLPFNENHMKFQLKNRLSIYPEITWNYVNINFHHYKIKSLHLISESLCEMKSSETGISLKQFLKKRFMVETGITYHYECSEYF